MTLTVRRWGGGRAGLYPVQFLGHYPPQHNR